MSAASTQTDRGLRCVGGIVLLALCLFLGLALLSYDWQDIPILHVPPNAPPHNLIGPVGAWLSFVLFALFGVGAYLAPAWCFIFGLILIFDRAERVWPRSLWLASCAFAVLAIVELRAERWAALCDRLNIVDTGGLVARVLVRQLLIRGISPVGTSIVVGALLVTSLFFLFEWRNLARIGRLAVAGAQAAAARVSAIAAAREDRRRRIEREEKQIEKRRRRLEKEMRRSRQEPKRAPRPAPAPAGKPPRPAEAEPRRPEPAAASAPPPPRPRTAAAPAAPADGETTVFTLPPLSLLDDPPDTPRRALRVDVETTGRILEETLKEFGIEAEMTNAQQGPVVTRYELLPAPGVRVERISSLSNNLALSLKATSIRVQAPIPGKGVVGVEVPNETSRVVYIREVLEGETWRNSDAGLPLVLGQDVGGNDIVADLARMPHLLIAGATGSGKTVCMNSILAGLLMSRTPSELRLMLVDPKIVEFSVYNHLPHLVVPVITNPKKVSLGLRWAINEMERRYKLFAKAGVRNIAAFNDREKISQGDLFGEEPEAAAGGGLPDKVPYIVIVIDELADLMLADQAEIENCIARLAQLSRAVGIHMILATQRPSVNVITGTIKANFPARIAFQVAQKVDSRTILDSVGADKLLGRGDMLFLPPGSSKLVRAQGAMTSDEEIARVTAHLKEQGEPSYEGEIKQKLEEKKPAAGAPDADGGEDEELLQQAVEIIRETRRASTSSLQRRLRIGYNRAGRLMDVLEERGVIGPPRGSDPREILIDLDGEIPDNAAADEDETD